MRRWLTIFFALAALAGTAWANAARAIVDEFGITTKSVSKVESNLYEVAYEDVLLVTSSCYVSAYNDPAVITRTQIIFVDANEVCSISEVRPK